MHEYTNISTQLYLSSAVSVQTTRSTCTNIPILAHNYTWAVLYQFRLQGVHARIYLHASNISTTCMTYTWAVLYQFRLQGVHARIYLHASNISTQHAWPILEQCCISSDYKEYMHEYTYTLAILAQHAWPILEQCCISSDYKEYMHEYTYTLAILAHNYTWAVLYQFRLQGVYAWIYLHASNISTQLYLSSAVSVQTTRSTCTNMSTYTLAILAHNYTWAVLYQFRLQGVYAWIYQY